MNIGDIVWVKMGSPPLIVWRIREFGEAEVYWFDENGAANKSKLPINALTDVEPPGVRKCPKLQES